VDHIKSNLSIWEDRKRENIEHCHETEQSTTTTVIGKHEIESSSSTSTSASENDDSTTTNTTQDEDYHTQAVNVLSTKDYKLPKMPAVAMTSIHQGSNIYHSSTFKDDNDPYDHGDWDPARTSSGPVYCQCTIQ
jgi:hypothetical protein